MITKKRSQGPAVRLCQDQDVDGACESICAPDNTSVDVDADGRTKKPKQVDCMFDDSFRISCRLQSLARSWDVDFQRHKCCSVVIED